jgi:uncharacterized alkaline shock family protein YloU
MTARVPQPGPGITAVADEAIAKLAAASVREVLGMRLARVPMARRALGGTRPVKVDGGSLHVELHVALPERAPLAETVGALVRHVVARTEELSGIRLHEIVIVVDELVEGASSRTAAPSERAA